jgi:hypothetical protein
VVKYVIITRIDAMIEKMTIIKPQTKLILSMKLSIYYQKLKYVKKPELSELIHQNLFRKGYFLKKILGC